MTTDQWIRLGIAAVIGVLAVARATRLLTHDDFPPTAALRAWYVTHTSHAWSGLMTCPFCLAPWLALVDLTWAALADVPSMPNLTADPFTVLWWYANIWFAWAYLASMVVVRDEPPEE